MSHWPAGTKRSAFTLLELLIVIGIIGILLGLLMGSVQAARQTAARVTCQNNLKQLCLAFQAADSAYGQLPPGVGGYPPPGTTAYGTGLLHILPFIGETALYRLATVNGFTWADYNDVLSRPVKVFICSSDPTALNGIVEGNQGAGCYAGNAQVFCRVDANGVLLDPQGSAALSRSFADGTSNTILFAEKYASCRNSFYTEGGSWWAYDIVRGPVEPLHPAFAVSWTGYSIGPGSKFVIRPDPQNCDPTLSSTAHTVMPVGLADGSVRSLSAGVSGTTWWAACTPAGGEVLGNDW